MFDQGLLKTIVEYLKEYWWALGLFILGICLVRVIFRKAETYAAGKWEGLIFLGLTVVFFLIICALILAAIPIAERLPVKLFVEGNNAVIRIHDKWGALPPIGTPMVIPTGPIPTPQNTPDPTQAVCPQISTGNHTVIWDPTASLHSGPLGSSPIIAQIPKGQQVNVLETSCVDDYDIGGETRRVRVRWNNGSQEIEGWLHVATIQH